MNNPSIKSHTQTPHEWIALILVTVGTVLAPMFTSFMENSNYIWSLILYTVLLYAVAFVILYFGKPWKIGSIKSLDYWYYGMVTIGAIMLAAHNTEERKDIELDIFAGPIGVFNASEYPELMTVCKSHLYKESALCDVFREFPDLFQSNEIDDLEEAIKLTKSENVGRKVLWLKIKSLIWKMDRTKALDYGSIHGEMHTMYKLARNKLFTINTNEKKATDWIKSFVVFFWPFVLILAFALKLSKTLVEHKGWSVVPENTQNQGVNEQVT
ncbi:hypothetical protein [Thalassotalea sp. PS06]|uniref:hypothetical protein n=1 Tax=Thalassotalea sp. PS06 TaxID=2594005 RepID=UPI0011638039|nr:hypothetical protein [Thalassotalea sp. PS06]QDP02182.1 hypothetical protein FNC98_13030 [Thalassotalea sp. PS06]